MSDRIHGIRERLRWNNASKYIYSYGPDWCLALFFYLLSKFVASKDGFKRQFSLNDISLQYTFATRERINSQELHLIAGWAPAILIPVLNLIFVRDLWDLHNGWLGLAFSLSLTNTLTNFVKVCVGRPRPDVIDRCQPLVAAASRWGLVDYTICSQTDLAILRDGFRSFPSGHSSMAFAGLGYLSLYLAGKLHVWDERGYTGKAWLSLVPVLGAALIAISRTMDYRHHWQDVLVGSSFGMIIAYFSYRQFFPSLTHAKAHRAFKPRFNNISEISINGTEEERRALYSRPSEEDSRDVLTTV
ncbi:hypothetical protein M422DRAFT_66054 [Sphaerobolus stellatus SS14]|nr:hypothetical protein M422DRAFT_66054 [Sphaerobolus stellatus SS14]